MIESNSTIGHDRPVNRLSESGSPLSIEQSRSLFPNFDEAQSPYLFTVAPALVIQLRRAGRLLIASDIKPSEEEGFYFGTINGERFGFEARHVFAEGLPQKVLQRMNSRHMIEAKRLREQGHSTTSIANMLDVEHSDVDAALLANA